MIRFTVLGQLWSLKNGKVLSTRGGRPRIIKIWKTLRFEETFARQVPVEYRNKQLGSLEKPLRVSVNVFYPSWRQDLDVEVIYDMLQKSGVIKNDRYIRVKHVDGTQIDP